MLEVLPDDEICKALACLIPIMVLSTGGGEQQLRAGLAGDPVDHPRQILIGLDTAGGRHDVPPAPASPGGSRQPDQLLIRPGGPPPRRSAASKPSSTARLPMFPRPSGKHVLGQIRKASGGTRHGTLTAWAGSGRAALCGPGARRQAPGDRAHDNRSRIPVAQRA